jgi:hypothetical protein
MKKKQILELFNMKLSKTIDQTRICKKSYDDPLGYFCMDFFLLVPSEKWPTNFTCPTDVSTCPGQSDKRYCRGLVTCGMNQSIFVYSCFLHNKIDRHDITEILLKVALSTTILTLTLFLITRTLWHNEADCNNGWHQLGMYYRIINSININKTNKNLSS